MEQKHWELIAKKLSGELSAEEEEQFSHWIKQSPENEKIFKEAEKIWNVSAELKKDYTPDTEKAWGKLKGEIESIGLYSKVIPLPRKNWLKIAAAILMLTVLGFTLKYLFSGNQTQPQNLQYVEVSTTDSINIFYLPDSSKIFLNKNSSISFVENFADTARITYLIGEAYFEVTKNTKSFIVYAGGTQVRVMGTSFNIKANEDDENLEVIVVEGKVAFKQQGISNDSAITIEPSDKITFDKNRKEYEKGKSTEKDLWWGETNLQKEVKKLVNKVKRKIK